MTLFAGLGFPVAWPIGRFWPYGLTAGVALGGINLEFLQLDEGSVAVARIRTLVFEPIDLHEAVATLEGLGLPMRISEKWEDDPEKLRLRGYSAVESQERQLICRNAIPVEAPAIDFFLCDYSPALKARLGPGTFPGLAPVREVVWGSPFAAVDADCLKFFGLAGVGPSLALKEWPERGVVEIRTDRGPIDLGSFAANFRFV